MLVAVALAVDTAAAARILDAHQRPPQLAGERIDAAADEVVIAAGDVHWPYAVEMPMDFQYVREKTKHHSAEAEEKANQHIQMKAASQAAGTDCPAKAVAVAARSCSPEGTCSPADPAPGRAATDSVR